MDIQNYTINGSLPPDFQEKRYLIIGHQVDNLGDIACAVKVANLLHRRFHISKDQITMTSNNPEQFQIFNKYQFKVISYEEATQRSEDDLLIAAPASAPDLGPFLKLGKPIVCVNEYEHNTDEGYHLYPWIHWASFGIGPNKIGILLSHKLAKAGFAPEQSLNPERMQLLETIDPFLKNQLLKDKSIEEFSHSHALYIAYTNDTSHKLHFIRAMAKLNQEEKKDLIFIFPGTNRRGIISADLKKEPLSFPPHLGISTLQLYEYAYKAKQFNSKFSQSFNCPGGKTLTIICGSFQHQDLKKLLSYSEKETLATGDQSISEAIAANKSWLYEYLLHKSSFANQLDSSNFNKTTKSVKSVADWEFMYSVFNQRKIDQYTDMTATNQLLYTRDCTSALSDLMKKALAPSPTPALIHLDSIKSSFSPEDFPLGTPVVVSINQICSLKIDISSKKSMLPMFAGSIFDAKFLGGSGIENRSYLVVRFQDKS